MATRKSNPDAVPVSDNSLSPNQKARTVTRTRYRVLSQRKGNALTIKSFVSLKRAQDRIGLLTSLEPWRFYGDEFEREREGSEYVCCPGGHAYECGCGGLTLAQDSELRRKDLPPIEWVRIETRKVTTTTTPWVPVTSEPGGELVIYQVTVLSADTTGAQP